MPEAMPEPDGSAISNDGGIVKQIAEIPSTQDGEKKEAEKAIRNTDQCGDGQELLKPLFVSSGIVLGAEGSDRGGEGIKRTGQRQRNA